MPLDLSIADASARTGLSPRTVRYYEEIGLLPGVRRKAGGRRVYGPEQIQRLAFIRRLKKLGLSLAEVKQLNAVYGIAGSTSDMLEHLDALLGRHLDRLDERIAELATLRNDMSEYRARVARRIDALPACEGGRPNRRARIRAGVRAERET